MVYITNYTYITCCWVDGDLSIELYSDITLLVVRKFGDGILDTPPLHWEWSCPLLNMKQNINTRCTSSIWTKINLKGYFVYPVLPKWLLLFKTRTPWSSLSHSMLLNFDFRLNEGLEIFHEYRLWSFSPFSPL